MVSVNSKSTDQTAQIHTQVRAFFVCTFHMHVFSFWQPYQSFTLKVLLICSSKYQPYEPDHSHSSTEGVIIIMVMVIIKKKKLYENITANSHYLKSLRKWKI